MRSKTTESQRQSFAQQNKGPFIPSLNAMVDVVHTPKLAAIALSAKCKPVRYRSRKWRESETGDPIDKQEADPDYGPDSSS